MERLLLYVQLTSSIATISLSKKMVFYGTTPGQHRASKEITCKGEMHEPENKEGSENEGKTRQPSDHQRKYLENKLGNIKYKMLHQSDLSTLALV